MLGRLIPRKGGFFELFNDHAAELVVAARALKALMDNGDNYERRAYEIESIEKRGDKIAQAVMELLHRTFITPIDRDDIHQLISKMDDILDLMEDASDSVHAFNVRVIPAEAKDLTGVCLACVEKVQTAVGMLSNMRDTQALLAVCHEVSRLESEADHLMRSAMARLFRAESDLKQVMTMRSIYELLETVTDRCEDVANIIEGIVLENG